MVLSVGYFTLIGGTEVRSEKMLLMLVVVMFVAGPAMAVPLGYGETHQEWTFDDDDNPAEPESDPDLNPYGTATAAISGSGAPPEWVSSWFEREGVWQAEPLVQLVIEVPNQMVDNPYKEIYVEIGFLGELDGFAVYPVPFGGSMGLIKPHEVEVVDPVNGWKKLIGWHRLEPNPGRERVCYSFSGAAAVDYVKINTVCVPEPLTISLLGLGGLMLRRRRRTV